LYLNVTFQSQAGLSLLAYCYFYTQDFIKAANCYEKLTLLLPEEAEYQLYYAQSLYQACLYEEAMKVTSQIDDPAFQGKVISLSPASCKYKGQRNFIYDETFCEHSCKLLNCSGRRDMLVLSSWAC
jgi:tetratricopeptide repeat protein 30